MSENEEKIFKCNLNDTNLFNCILNEVGEGDLNSISIDSPKIMDETIINCINASLIVCLRNIKEELELPRIQVKTLKTKSGNWIINQINVIVNEQINDELIYSRINQCLKFVNKGCNNDDSIKFSIIKSEDKEDLKNYKIKLLELNQWLKNIRDDKSKKEKLFTLFRDIESN